MVSICRPAELDSRVAALGPAQLLEALQECSVTGLRFPVVRSQAHYDTDAPDALGLLRPRRERPRGRGTAEQRDEQQPSGWSGERHVHSHRIFAADAEHGRTTTGSAAAGIG